LKDANKSTENNIEETEIKENEEKVMIGIKVSPTHKKILEKHFKNYRGTTLSSGIRELIFSYMRENDLI